MNVLEERLIKIEARNKKVEADKAWEVSWVRRGSIMLITYATVVAFLFAINKEQPFINAFVPVIGYVLSTLALPQIKKKWIESR